MPITICISDSSTLIHLAAIGRLALLRKFYGKITIPSAVWQEVVVEGKSRAGAAEVRRASEAGWIEVAPPQDEVLIRLLKRELDEGESEVIALAVEQGSAEVLLDESDARQIAELYSIPKTGVIGLLIRAKQEGEVGSLRQELDRLCDEAGFWIREEFYREILQSVGELNP